MTFLFIAIGFLAGILSGIFGIGGGIVIAPALIYFARYAPITATGTSLGALLLPVGLLGVIEYHRRGHINITASLWIAMGLFFGAWIGAQVAHQLSPLALKRSFAVLLVAVAAKMWFA
ncbi:MAG: TSUP family transporter [Gemmatimonadales bacterium]